MEDKNNILTKIKAFIKELEPKSEIILFGSQARGDERKNSDWDLLILTPEPINLKGGQKFRHKLFELELQYNQVISTLVKSKKDWEDKYSITPLYENIKQEGIQL